jgi:hypothetical protein
MKYKKGISFFSEYLGIILVSLLVLLLLFYLSWRLFFASSVDTKLVQSEGVLYDILTALDKMKVGDEHVYLYLAPNDYYFYSSDLEKSVSKCGSNFCLCLCDSEDEECKGDGICKKSPMRFDLGNSAGKNIPGPEYVLLIKREDYYYLEVGKNEQ